MESALTMGEASDNVCKEKSKTTEDKCVNGDCDAEAMEVDSKAPEVNSNDVDLIEDDDDDEVPDVQQKQVPADEPIDSKERRCAAADEEDDDDDDDEESATAIKRRKIENGSVEAPILNGTLLSGDDEEEVEKEVKEATSIDLSDDKDGAPSALNDSSGDVVLVENTTKTDTATADNSKTTTTTKNNKENGELVCSSPEVEEIINLSDKDSSLDIINLTSSPAKSQKQAQKKKPLERLSEPTRRSTRNLNKQKSYIEKEDDPDVEEVTPEDPLADPLRDDKENNKKTVKPSSSTIVVSDTKRLVEIAANSKSSTTPGKKEPTLVIIDTNSILSGRGPVPVSHKSQQQQQHHHQQLPASFSMMPVALPAQGVYPPNMRATITPIPMSSSKSMTSNKTIAKTTSSLSKPNPLSKAAIPTPVTPPAAPILPTLTDDMFVVEAPSFIVPYVYEKPPIKQFKEFVTQIHKELLEQIKKDELEEEQKQQQQDDDDNKVSDDEEQQRPPPSKKSKPNDDEANIDLDEKILEENEKKKKDQEQRITATNQDDIIIADGKEKPKSSSYFDNALGQFFINIGYGLVQEFVQTDLLKQQKRKQKSEGAGPETKQAINSLIKNLEYSKENNEPYKMEIKRCEFCSFKTESDLVLAHHLETPHMRNYVYKCNFCPLEVRSPHDILFHMEAEHNTRGRLERAPAFHQCPSCPFEDNQKGKLSRHLVNCVKKFKPERNLEPPSDWEPPAKIPRVPRAKQQGLSATVATYQALAQAKGNYQLFSKLQQQAQNAQLAARGRGRPTMMSKINMVRPTQPIIRTNMMYRPSTSGTGASVLVPASYQFGNQIYQVVGGQTDLGAGRLHMSGIPSHTAPGALVPNLASPQSTVTIQNSTGSKSSTGNKSVQQPSISITPLPRQSASGSASVGSSTTITKTGGNSGANNTSSSNDPSSKATFVICEICDGYIKDLEQLRNHMQWIHKVKIHPKMIYNRPPLNCQKCQFRFFTDQGLERHLLGSHGLVTSSMQEAANKSKDAGRCPVCGRVYQWKLLNHVARDHNMTLKPAHLSYKCTVCTATFGMYKQFENHVYSAHSVVAKRVMDKKGGGGGSTTTTTPPPSSAATPSTSKSSSNDSLLKPLKINDEITIIPQPAKKTRSSTTTTTSSAAISATVEPPSSTSSGK